MSLHVVPAGLGSASAQQAEDAQYYRRVLHELIDRGADIARLVHQQATTQAEAEAAQNPDGAAGVDCTVAFERIARTVRRSIMLAQRVAEPMPVAAHPAWRRIAARKRIIREVEDAIERRAQDCEAEALHAELLDRLDGPDLDDEIDGRPVAEIIADICRDLGLAAQPGTHPWKRRTPDDITRLCARAAEPLAAATPNAPAPNLPVPIRAAPSLVRAAEPGAQTGSDPPPPAAEPKQADRNAPLPFRSR